LHQTAFFIWRADKHLPIQRKRYASEHQHSSFGCGKRYQFGNPAGGAG